MFPRQRTRFSSFFAPPVPSCCCFIERIYRSGVLVFTVLLLLFLFPSVAPLSLSFKPFHLTSTCLRALIEPTKENRMSVSERNQFSEYQRGRAPAFARYSPKILWPHLRHALPPIFSIFARFARSLYIPARFKYRLGKTRKKQFHRLSRERTSERTSERANKQKSSSSRRFDMRVFDCQISQEPGALIN